MDRDMIFIVVFGLSTLTRIYSNTVTSPQIRILDVATKSSETRLIPHSVEYRNLFNPYLRPNRFDQNSGPLKSYVIYDDYPLKIFKEWKGSPTDFRRAQNFLEFGRQPNTEFAQELYGQEILPPPKPTLAYRSVYSNVIKVFDDSLGNLGGNRPKSDRYIKPYGENIWRYQPSVEYDPTRFRELLRRQPYHNLKLPENFPNLFSPNYKFHFSSNDERVPQNQQNFYPREGFYNTHTVNYNEENEGNSNEVEMLSEEALNQKNKRKPFLCGFIRLNQRLFPENGVPCRRSEDDYPLSLPDYPNYANLPDHKIPVEHRRQHFQMKRIKRSESNDSLEGREKRDVGFGYGYSNWGSPFSYDSGYDGYFSENYPDHGNYRGFDSNYNSHYYNNRDRNQNYRNTYYSGSRYDENGDDDQNDDYSSRGLTGYLTNGGRRYKSRKNNNDDENEDENDENDSENNNNNNNSNSNNNNNNNNNNRDSDSDEEMERMNSNRRDNNRRNNEDSRDRRRNNNNSNNYNNNNNDDDDYRDNRRNNNRNSNSRRYNSNNRRFNNDRYDYGSNRNRYYGNNGYGSYGGYGNGGFGSGYSSNGGYGSSYGNNGGYGSSYGSNSGYGYGGYGNGFGSF